MRHLPTGLVAGMALLLALTTTAYAGAQLANGSVTTKELAKNAVKSAKIKDRSVQARDLATGVVPGDARTWVGQGDSGIPVAGPEGSVPDDDQYSVLLPRRGEVVVSYFASRFGAACTSGYPYLGLYVDDVPIAGTEIGPYSGETAAVTTSGAVELAAGPHEFAMGVDCPHGTYGGMGVGSSVWTVALLAQ